MAIIINTLFTKIFEALTTVLENAVGERFTNCINFNDNIQSLEENMQLLTSKASDMESKVKQAELSGTKRRSAEVKNWLEKVEEFKTDFEKLQSARFCKPLCRGNRAKILIEVVEKHIKQSFNEVLIDAWETDRKRLFVSDIYGETFKRNLNTLLTWSLAKSNEVPCIGIHGMGGVGKSTLAQQLVNHIQDKHNDIRVCWVVAAQERDITKLQNTLAKELKFELPKNEDVATNAATLNRVLKEKKNVIVIFDDVWKDFELRSLGIVLGMEGCKVIITSRLLDVCKKMDCRKYVITVGPFNEEEAWELFFKELKCDEEFHPEVEEVAREMAKKCSGLPLAIKTVANSMVNVYDVFAWRDALEDLKQSLMGQNDEYKKVLSILEHSFNRLEDQSLKQCFLYCCLYPEDYEVSRDELVRKFISEGFLMPVKRTKAAEYDKGHTKIKRLIDACLLERVGDNNVKMHDLVREMAIEITRNNPNFMAKAGLGLDELPDEQEWKENLDKVSLMFNNISEIPEGSSPNCPQLSTLILSDNPVDFIPDSFFAHMNGLQVLDLSGTPIQELPSFISELENLTTLLLGFCHSLCYMPPLNKLKELRELNISWTRMKEVPEGLGWLVKLQYLNMRGMENLEEIPCGLLSGLSSIQQLMLPFHVTVDVKEIESLKLLEEFEGTVTDMFNSEWLNKYPTLNKYTVLVGQGQTYHDAFENAITFNHYSKGAQEELLLPQNMKALCIIDSMNFKACLLDSFPSLCDYKDMKTVVIEHSDELESIMEIHDDEFLKNVEELRLKELPNYVVDKDRATRCRTTFMWHIFHP